MSVRWVGLAAALGIFAVSGLSHADCTKDTDCKGDRICEGGRCVSPVPVAPPAVTEPSATTPTSAAPPPADATSPAATPANEPATAGAEPQPVPQGSSPAAVPTAPATRAAELSVPAEKPPAEKPRMKRHSTGMMVGGIVMVSLAPIALIATLVASAEKDSCESSYELDGSSNLYGKDCSRFDARIYGFGLGGLALVGAGVPLIVLGAKKEPVETPAATIAPWLTATSAGVGMKLRL